MFIPDPNRDFLPIPDPGFKKAPNPGSGRARLFKSLPRAGVKHAVSTTAQLVSANDFTQLRGLLSRAELRRLKKEVPQYLICCVANPGDWGIFVAIKNYN
jgi:hypothetical protein